MLLFIFYFCRLELNLLGFIVSDVLDEVSEADLQFPVTKKTDLAHLSPTISFDNLSLLQLFVVEGPVEGDPLTARYINRYFSSHIDKALDL